MIDDGRPLYHLTLVGRLHGNQTQNGYYFIPASAHTAPDYAAEANAICERFNAICMPYIKDFAHQQWAIIGLICATVIPRYGPIVERPFEVAGGNQTGECLPSSNAGILSLRTGLGGRSNHGRTYYTGISSLDSEQSRLTASSLTRLQGIGDSLLTGFGSADADNEFHYGVYSHKLGDVDPPPPAVGKLHTLVGFNPVTATIARPIVGTQRHRLSGHGP